jgi:hypothetical protein
MAFPSLRWPARPNGADITKWDASKNLATPPEISEFRAPTRFRPR